MLPGQRAEGGTAEDKASLHCKLPSYAAAAALMVNPHFQALLATIGTALQGEDEEE
jgi:hypothetical protein